MYHLFEQHDSDSNDNFITDVIVEAETVETAFEVIDSKIVKPYEDTGLGDDTLAIYEYVEEYENVTEEERENAMTIDDIGRMISQSFYYQSSHETLEGAEAECATYHGGPIYLLAEVEVEVTQ